jgi:predicted acetyltransferase/SAM-dependent methyltransferase
MEPIIAYYNGYDEDGRLLSQHGRVEYLTTMRYIERYLAPGARVIEIGAGTGRYSHAIARAGYQVDAVELVAHNIEQFRRNMQPGAPVTIRQGDATDLSFAADDSYDITLLLGPMYHLFTEAEKLRALSEAMRVTKPSGVLFVAYCIADASILHYGFIGGHIHELIARGMVETEGFRASSEPSDLFELHRKEDIDRLMAHFDAERLHYVATDLYTNHMRDAVDGMDARTFELYMRYHFAICERADMAGLTNHSLDIVRKRQPSTLEQEIADYNALPVVFEGFIEPEHLTDGEIALVATVKTPAVPERARVPAYRFSIRKDGAHIGNVSLRIGYTDELYYGGQIGYDVDEAHRGRGYAVRACRLLGRVLRAHGMEKALITNDVDNHASRRVCEKLGARFLRTAELPEDHPLYREGQRYVNVYEWVVE